MAPRLATTAAAARSDGLPGHRPHTARPHTASPEGRRCAARRSHGSGSCGSRGGPGTYLRVWVFTRARDT